MARRKPAIDRRGRRRRGTARGQAKTDESSVKDDLTQLRVVGMTVARSGHLPTKPRRYRSALAQTSTRSRRDERIQPGPARLVTTTPAQLRCRTQRPCGARPGKRIRQVVVRSFCLVRQTRVRFSDDFAVIEVELPSFCNQRANTCEPAGGFGGTIGDIRRLHDEAPYRWRVRDNPNHNETPPSCEMRFRYMRITDNLCCCCAT